jgi:Protein of unknown function (DUF5818)
MKSKFPSLLLFVSCAAMPVVAGSTYAQVPDSTTQSSQDTSQDKSDNSRTLTGCLSQGGDAKSFNLLADDGSTWVLRSKTATLSDHVGHTVTVTGKVWHGTMHGAKEKTKDAVDPGAEERGHLNVASISMVSDTCKK